MNSHLTDLNDRMWVAYFRLSSQDRWQQAEKVRADWWDWYWKMWWWTFNQVPF